MTVSGVTVSAQGADMMNITKNLPLLILLFLLTACGPIIGQFERAGEGIKSFEVVQGKLSDLKGESSLLVLGPFGKTSDAYYICRGEDAARYDEEFNKTGLFRSELYVERNRQNIGKIVQDIRAKTPMEIKDEFGLAFPPEKVLIGTLLNRKTTVAPTRGVIMSEGYRLEFYDTRFQKSVIIEVFVKTRPESTVPSAVKEITSRILSSP